MCILRNNKKEISKPWREITIIPNPIQTRRLIRQRRFFNRKGQQIFEEASFSDYNLKAIPNKAIYSQNTQNQTQSQTHDSASSTSCGGGIDEVVREKESDDIVRRTPITMS